MLRTPIGCLLLLLTGQSLPSVPAQDPDGAAEESSLFWSATPRPARPIQPPIVPEHWLVLRRESNSTLEQVFARHLLDPESSLPTVQALNPGGLPWQLIDTKCPAGVVAAFTRVSVPRDEVRMARLTGGETLFVNGDGFVGDVSKRGFRGVPVLLRKGDNDLYVLGIPDSFELELWCQQTRVVVGTWDIAWPGETTDAV